MPSFSAHYGTEIPSYLFNTTDASSHVFDFLSDPRYGHAYGGSFTSGGSVSNWTEFCYDGGNAVLGYGPFLGCLLYSNVTRRIRDGTLPANLTDIGFSSDKIADVISTQLRSWMPTCLVAYCTSQSDCASTHDCNVGRLLTDSGRDMSAAGVAQCWQTLCSLNVQALNADFAGLGVIISYLIQSVIALLGLVILAMLAFLAFAYNRKAKASSTNPDAEKRLSRSLSQVRRHWEIVIAALSDFHRAQCYLAIALQIASFVLIFSDLSSTSYNDQNFLLLVGLAGLIPIVLTLYALMTFGKKSWYMINLSIITVILSAAQGYHITHYILLPQTIADATSINTAGGKWPVVCGNQGPSALCSGLGPNTVGFNDDAQAFNAIAATLLAITALLVLWKFLSDWLGRSSQRKNTPSWQSKIQQLGRIVRPLFHTIVAIGVLGCLFVEFYYFDSIFHSPFVNPKNWSFGQIVGITTWAGVIIDFAYLEYFGIDEGSNWRFPKWLHIKDSSKSAAPTSFDNTNGITTPSPRPGDKTVSIVSSTSVSTPSTQPSPRTLEIQRQAPSSQLDPRRSSTPPATNNV